MLGSPIAHSKSPALHRAAYAVLGLDWQYEAIDVVGPHLAQFVDAMGPEWRGLSLTMPLKRDVLPLLDSSDDVVALTGAANTVLVADGLHGFNTDVAGIVAALQGRVAHTDSVLILGGGATAGSALVAAAQLGFAEAHVQLRDVGKAHDLRRIGESLAVQVHVSELGSSGGTPDLVVSTLPGHADVRLTFSRQIRESSVLFDVAYDPWPSALAAQWIEAGSTVVPGIEMLASQALVQVRIFVSGDPQTPLANEPAVWSAMRSAVGI